MGLVETNVSRRGYNKCIIRLLTLVYFDHNSFTKHTVILRTRMAKTYTGEV